jgi:pyruvate dehydrogenase E1 component alpha subunit
MSDPAKYRSKDEVQQIKENSDCMLLAERRLLNEFGVSEAELAAVRADVEAEAQDAWDFAEASDEPSLDRLYDYVYAPSGQE